MSNNNSKANWDLGAIRHFIDVCWEQVLKKERNATTFTKKGWIAIVNDFNERAKRSYDRTQLKNKWDNLKKDWQVWYKLFGKETGLGWCPLRHTVEASDEWWERKIQENPKYANFREKGLPFARDLTKLFKDVAATGNYAWTPSSGVEPDSDVYRPTLPPASDDLQEGSGDSDEVHLGTTPLSGEFQGVQLNNSQATTSAGSRKRKRAEAKKKSKASNSKHIADSLSRIADSAETPPGLSIEEVLAELSQIEEVRSDLDWYARCCSLLMSRTARDVFVFLRREGLHDNLLTWLRVESYKT